MPWFRLKSAMLLLCVFIGMFALTTFFLPPERAAHAEAGPAADLPPIAQVVAGPAAPEPQTDAGGWAGVAWDFAHALGLWKALFVALVMGSVTALNLGGGATLRRLAGKDLSTRWARVVDIAAGVIDSNEFKLASVFVLAFAWSWVKSLADGDHWSRAVFVDASDFAAKAVTGNQIWKHVLKDRVKGVMARFGADDPAPEPNQ